MTMIEHFKSMIEGLSHPPIRHAAMIHFPIALATVSLGLAAASAIMRKNSTLRCVTFITLLVLVGASWIARQSGEDAERSIKRLMPDAVHEIAEEHEDMGKSMLLYAGAAAVAGLLTMITRNRLQAAFAWLTVLACAASVAWVSVTAHLGGKLVYEHGVGTPLTSSSGSQAVPSKPVESAADEADSTEQVKLAFFRNTVQPILAQNCVSCHNPRRAASGKSGRLDQTSRESLLKGGESGPAIVPGNPEQSLLVHRIRGDDPDEKVMPPDGKLNDEQIAALMQWIREGAVWEPAAPAPPAPPG